MSTQILNMAQCRETNLLLHEFGIKIVPTCYMNPSLPVLPLQFLVIALFQDTTDLAQVEGALTNKDA